MTVDHLHAGPFHKHPQPVLKSDGAVVGPGACCIVRGPNDTEWMLYHSWNPERTYRAMSIAELTWHEDKPVVHASWGKPQHAPFFWSDSLLLRFRSFLRLVPLHTEDICQVCQRASLRYCWDQCNWTYTTICATHHATLTGCDLECASQFQTQLAINDDQLSQRGPCKHAWNLTKVHLTQTQGQQQY